MGIRRSNMLHPAGEKLDLTDKVQLQKLVYPAGLLYVAENHALRTTVINPIFSAITSISKELTTNNTKEKYAEEEKLSQLYLVFSSSNFLWNNLEEIAMQLDDLSQSQYEFSNSTVSMTGRTESMNYFQTTSTTIDNSLKNQFIGLYPSFKDNRTGSTQFQLFNRR